MMRVLRFLRGALGTALAWAVLWLPIGFLAAIYGYSKLPPPDLLPPPPFSISFFLRYVTALTVAWIAWGAACGAIFALLLGLIEHRRDLDGLSRRRTVIWGALGTTVLPGIILVLVLAERPGFELIKPALLTLFISAALGAACGAATITLAKRPPVELSDPHRARSSLTSA
jgi:hypothetical protein